MTEIHSAHVSWIKPIDASLMLVNALYSQENSTIYVAWCLTKDGEVDHILPVACWEGGVLADVGRLIREP